MKLFEIQIATIEIPFRISIDHHLKKRKKSQSFIITIIDSNGLRGFGEGAPRSYVNNESIAQCLSEFERLIWPTELSDIWAIKCFVESLRGQKISNALIAAIELALLDLFGQLNSECISEYLHTSHDFHLEYSIVLPFMPLPVLERYLEKIKELRPPSLKFKVGREGDVHALRLIRQYLPDVTLRLDANCAWSIEKAVLMIQSLSQFDISSIEEPLLQNERHLLGSLATEVDVPLMLDESIYSLEDAEFYAANISPEHFKVNLKISKMGGLFQTEKIHSFLLAQGISCQLGCNVGETSLLSGAGRIFAQRKELVHLEGSLGPLFMDSDITSTPLSFGKEGKALHLSDPGLGVDVSNDLLQKYTISQKSKRIKNGRLLHQTY